MQPFKRYSKAQIDLQQQNYSMSVSLDPQGSRLASWISELQLAACVVGIYVSYLVYGIIQERIFKHDYGSGTLSYFRFPLFMVFAQCFIGACASAITIAVKDNISNAFFYSSKTTEQLNTRNVQTQFAICALVYLLSMVFGNAALQFISYPLQVLAKSSKMIPVMFVGALILKRNYTYLQVFRVLLVTSGIVLFSMSQLSSIEDQQDVLGPRPVFGMILVSLSLLMDGISGPLQEKICSDRGASSSQMMLFQNIHASMMLSVALIISGEGLNAIAFFTIFPQAARDVLLFAILSAIGQTFVFFTVANFSALTCVTVTTTRKLFTVALSVLWYGHNLTNSQWLAIAIVFSGIFWETAEHIRNKKIEQQEQKQQPQQPQEQL